jgi:cystathionine beta-lyase
MKVSGTRLVHGGRGVSEEGGRTVNPPVVRASTAVFGSVAAQREARVRREAERLFTYGARGTPTGFALESMIAELEGGHRTRLFPTGLAAIAMTFFSYLAPGDHVLIVDSVYDPVRRLAASQLARLGIRSTFFRPDDDDLDSRIAPDTRMIYLETPGSVVFEMSDLPAIAGLARRRGLLLVADNTWGSGLQYRPLALGADVSIMAATKYLSGHSDVVMGAVTTTAQAWPAMTSAADDFGMTTSPDDAYLVLRGIRTLGARLAMHEAHALKVASWLQDHPAVAETFCPALPAHPGHAIWQRDCSGTNGLLSFALRDAGAAAAERFVDALRLFAIGASWGGYESVVSVMDMTRIRTLTDWSGRSPVIRLHVGLEDPDDLIADLELGFASL